jgi:hypothetical protein
MLLDKLQFIRMYKLYQLYQMPYDPINCITYIFNDRKKLLMNTIQLIV